MHPIEEEVGLDEIDAISESHMRSYVPSETS